VVAILEKGEEEGVEGEGEGRRRKERVSFEISLFFKRKGQSRL